MAQSQQEIFANIGNNNEESFYLLDRPGKSLFIVGKFTCLCEPSGWVSGITAIMSPTVYRLTIMKDSSLT